MGFNRPGEVADGNLAMLKCRLNSTMEKRAG